MRKSIFLTIWTAFLTVIFFTGCNLYLDEDNTPQEEKGYDAPVHIKTDTLEMTYQFNEGVKQLTKNVQQYLEKVEADTILYFNTGTPHDYLPLPGGYVCAELSEKLPTGLMGYVLSVQNEDGYIRVVTTAAGLKEIFKVLRVEVEKPVNYDHCYVLPDTTVNDSTIFVSNDTTDYLRIPSDESLWSKPNNWETRNGDEDDEDIESGWHEGDPDVSTFEISLDTRKIPLEKDLDNAVAVANFVHFPKIPTKMMGVMKFAKNKKNKFDILGGIDGFKNWYFAVTYNRTNKETVHCIIDTDKEEVEYWTKDETTHTVTVEGGYYAGASSNSKPGEWLASKTVKRGRLQMVQAVDGPEIVIPCFTWGGIVISTSLDIEADAKICGVGTYSYVSVKKSGAKYVNGELTTIDEKTPSGSSKFNFDFVGSAKFEASFHIGAGVRIGKGVSLDLMIGGFATFGAEAKYSFDMDEWVALKNPINDETYARVYVDVGPELRFRVKFASLSLIDENFPFNVWHPLDKKWTLYPEIETSSSKITLDEDALYDEDQVNFLLEQKYRFTGILAYFLGKKLIPFVRVYKGKTLVKDWVYPNEATVSDWPIQKSSDFVYHYSFNNMEDDVLYHAVPCFVYDYTIYENNENAYYFTSASPYIFLLNSGGERKQVYYQSWGKTGSYYFVLQPTVSGVSKMKKWGIHVVVRNTNSGRKVYDKRIPVNLTRSQQYTLGMEFQTSMKALEFTFEPYAEVVRKDGKTERVYYTEEAFKAIGDYTMEIDEFMKEWYSYKFDKSLSPDMQ